MGIEISKTSFDAQDYTQFQVALDENLTALGELLATPGFGGGPGSLGAELEMYIVDSMGKPLHLNQEILAAADNPQLTLELNRYNLEYNLTPYTVDQRPFISTENEILAQMAQLQKVAAEFGGRIVATGILPTLHLSDFGTNCITDRKRYHALVKQLLTRRGNNFRIDIDGEDPLQLDTEDITLEGANTSFQVHYRVKPGFRQYL